MKHIKEYDEVDLQDTQEMGLAKKLRGWWVSVGFRGNLNYFIIYETSKVNAMWRLISHDEFRLLTNREKEEEKEAIMDTLRDYDGFSDLSDFVLDRENNPDEIFDVHAWECTPPFRDIRKIDIMVLNQPYNVKRMYEMGKKYFKDFDKVMNRYYQGNA